MGDFSRIPHVLTCSVNVPVTKVSHEVFQQSTLEHTHFCTYMGVGGVEGRTEDF